MAVAPEIVKRHLVSLNNRPEPLEPFQYILVANESLWDYNIEKYPIHWTTSSE